MGEASIYTGMFQVLTTCRREIDINIFKACFLFKMLK